MSSPRSPGFQPRDVLPGHSALALCVPYWFERLGIAVTLVGPRGWHALHTMPNAIAFEHEHGLEVARWEYNERSMAKVARSHKSLITRHAGFSDLFTPVTVAGQVKQLLVTGPFLRASVQPFDLVERWQALTGRYAHVADSEFVRYASIALDTLVVDDARLGVLQRMMESIADLITGRGDPVKLAPELERMVDGLADLRFATRMWRAAHAMVDPHTTRAMASPSQSDQLAELSLERVPEQALVTLIVNRDESVDAVEDLVKRDAFQRGCVDLARARGNTACGRIGDHGVAFLVPQASESRVKAQFAEIAERAARLARQLRFKLHAGTSSGARGASLPANYQAALGAAQEALSRRVAMVHGFPDVRPAADPLSELRQKLGEMEPARPLDFSTRFERYLQAVAVHTGYRLEAARLHVKIGYERLAEPLIARGLLETGVFHDLASKAGRAADVANTIRDLFETYRRAVSDLESMLARPVEARRESNLQRAVTFIHEHLGDSFRLADAARAGGFSPHYLSRLFKQREHVTFERYVQRLRVERAKQLLARTKLDLGTVGRLCGFASTSYFHRVFRQIAGATPRRHRRQATRELERQRARVKPSARRA